MSNEIVDSEIDKKHTSIIAPHYFFNKTTEEIKRYAKTVICVLLMSKKSSFLTCDENEIKMINGDHSEMMNSVKDFLGVDLYASLPKKIFKEKRIKIEERRLNPDTNRMKKYIEYRCEYRLIEENFDYICQPKIMGRAYLNFIHSELLSHEMNQKKIGQKQPYAGKQLIKLKNDRIEYSDRFLAAKEVKIDGQWKSLLDMKKGNWSKISEIWVEQKGYQERAEELGMTWMFITITAPAQFHPNPKKGHNKNWVNGTKITEIKKWFNDTWGNMKKRVWKKGGGFEHLKWGEKNAFGVKVVEPHKDGCPHWHIMFYCKSELLNEYKNLFKQYFSHSSKAIDFRVQGIDEDGSKINEEKMASASSYLFKYILKYVCDGQQEIENDDRTPDERAKDAKELVAFEAVRAWRGAGGFKSFTPFGVRGKKTLYRNARKIKNQQNKGFFEVEEDLSWIVGRMLDMINIEEVEDDKLEELVIAETEKELDVFDEVMKLATKTKWCDKKEQNINNVNYNDYMRVADSLDYENIYKIFEEDGKQSKQEFGIRIKSVILKYSKFDLRITNKTLKKQEVSGGVSDDSSESQNRLATIVHNYPRAEASPRPDNYNHSLSAVCIKKTGGSLIPKSTKNAKDTEYHIKSTVDDSWMQELTKIL